MPRSCVALGVAMTAAASLGSASAFTAPLSSQLSHRHHQQESSLRMMSSEGEKEAAAVSLCSSAYTLQLWLLVFSAATLCHPLLVDATM